MPQPIPTLPKEYTEDNYERNLQNEILSHLDVQYEKGRQDLNNSRNAEDAHLSPRAGLPQNFRGISRKSPGRMNPKDLKSPMDDIF